MRFYQHPEYVKEKPEWDQYKAYYEGERCELIKPCNLWLHEFEKDITKGGDILRAIRVNRTRYVNFCVSIIQKYISLTFQNKIDFSQVVDLFSPVELVDIDGNGNSVESYIHKLIARDFFLYGKTIDEITSDAEGRVYFRHWAPQDLIDWQISSSLDDQYVMTYKEILSRQSLHEQPKVQDYAQYLYYDGSQYVAEIYVVEGDNTSETSWTLVDTITPGVDFVPVVVTENESWVERILPILMTRYNLQSALDNILNYQAHQKIIISGPHMQGDGLIMSEAGVTFVQDGSTVTVVEPSNPAALKERLEQATADLWRVAFFQNRLIPADSRAVESSETIKVVKEDLINAIKLAGESISNHVNQLVGMFAAYKGTDIGEKEVAFDFNIEIDDQEFINLAALFMQDIKQYDTWTKEVYKRVAKKMNVDNPELVMSEIENKVIARPQTLSLASRLNGGAGTVR